MKSIRVAIIGTGFIGHYHTRALLKVPGVEVVAACSQPRSACEQFAHEFGIPHVTTDALSLAQRDDIDAAVLGLPNKFHAPYAVALLQAGKDVFVEKPMAINPAEGEVMGRAAKKHRRVLMSGHMWRFDTEVNYVKKVVSSGLIGKIVKTKGFGIHVNWGPAGWFADQKLAGGGALADMGVHALDTVRYLMGDPKPVRVYAAIGTYYGDYDVDDSGVLMISWDNGATSIIESGWWQPHMDGPEAGTRLYGTQGYASLFPTEFKYKIEGRAGEFSAPMPPRADHCEQAMYDRQMEHFIACIRRRKQPSPGFAEGQTILRIVAAAYRSSKTGQAVRL
jgi:predicted dehydrogenase